MLLSILIPTTPDREETLNALLIELHNQIGIGRVVLSQHPMLDYLEKSYGANVEVIVASDNKVISVGRKRQLLLEEAKGEYVSGVDSDDSIHPDYIKDILEAIKNNPGVDHVGFEEDCTINGEKSKSIFSIRHKQWDENKDGYDHIRCANPKSVIKREKALQIGYQDLRYSEDRVFSEAVTAILETEVFIPKPLYFYQHVSSDHNTRYGIKEN